VATKHCLYLVSSTTLACKRRFALNFMKSLETHLRDTEWMGCLGPELAAYVQAQAIERHVPAGSFVYSRGMEPEFWIGVIEGLLLMCRNSQAGRTTAVASVHCGDWIGEASLLFLKQRQFDLVAVRASRLACIPRATFRHLYETSIPFNHYLVLKLGKRVGQFARLISSDRMLTPVGRIALCFTGFVDSQGLRDGDRVEITQMEAGRLTGLSRQHVNKALHALAESKVICIERGGVRILDIEPLRALIS